MRRRAGALVAAAVAAAALAPPAAAEPAAALLPGNVLWTFDTASPGTVTVRDIIGLGAFETARGIDVRPATGQVYVTTVVTGSANNSVLRTYTLDTASGKATFLGSTGIAIAGAGDVPTGWDSNAAGLDRFRYLNTNDENLRINPDSAALAGNDADLTPAATTTAIGLAFDRNRLGQPASTAYAIDRNDGAVALVGGIDGSPTPNGGAVTDLAPLGVNLHPTRDGGFDVSPSGTAYAALTSAGDNVTRIYTVALPTAVSAAPAATAVGPLFNGSAEIYSLAILDDDRDRDGRLTTADNCPAVANADQADLDKDGRGDPCDDDVDGDGLSDATESLIGTNARSSDSDGDGRADAADRCPTVAAADGCPAASTAPPAPGPGATTPVTPLTLSVSGVPSRIALRALRGTGVPVTVAPGRPAALLIELLGTARGARIAAAGDIVLGERRLPRAAGRRSTRVRVARAQQRRLRRRARLRVRVTATDALGVTTVVTRRLTVR